MVAHSFVFHLEHGGHPTDWKRGVVVPIWKGKGDTQGCNNYREVTLLSVPGKVLARILVDRVRQKLLTHQRHEQPGFTPKKSTVDRILALRVLTDRLRFGYQVDEFWGYSAEGQDSPEYISVDIPTHFIRSFRRNDLKIIIVVI